MAKSLYIFVTSDRPDQYLNPILHCLQQNENLRKIVFVHVEGDPDGEDNPNVSARLVRKNAEALLTILADQGKYKYFTGKDKGKEVDLSTTYTPVELASLKEKYSLLKTREVSWLEEEINYFQLRARLVEIQKEEPDSVFDVSAVKKSYLSDILVIAVVEGINGVHVFDLERGPNFDYPWKSLFHELINAKRVPNGYQYSQLTARSIFVDCRKSIIIHRPITREESFSEWLNSLPFPLASILWRYSTLGDDYKRKYETLLHFFEALAEFMATLFLSGFITEEDLFKEKCLQLREILPTGSLENATFGTWVKIAEFLAKESRKMLHGNLEDQERCMKIFKVRSNEILAMLFSKELIAILQQTNAYRNDWTGHGGITSSRDNIDRHTVLEEQLSKLRNVLLATKWEKYSLIRPGLNRYISGIYNYRAEQIVGYGTPFAEKEIKTDVPMEYGSLYFLAYDELKPMKLLPLIWVKQNACYFYNRRRTEGARFVSYHFEDNSDIVSSSEDIHELLQKLTASLRKETN